MRTALLPQPFTAYLQHTVGNPAPQYTGSREVYPKMTPTTGPANDNFSVVTPSALLSTATPAVSASHFAAVPTALSTLHAALGITHPQRPENPLLDLGTPPRLDEIKPEHVLPAMRQIEAYTREELARLEEHLESLPNPPTWGDVYDAWNELQQPLRRAWVVINQLNDLVQSPEWEKVFPEAQNIKNAVELLLQQSRPMYDAFAKIGPGTLEWFNLSEAQRRIVSSVLLKARLKGIELEGAAKERFNKLYQEVSVLQMQFRKNDTKSRKETAFVFTDKTALAGLAKFDLESMAKSYALSWNEKNPDNQIKPDAINGPWRVDSVTHVDFLTRADNRDLREKVFKAYQVTSSSGETDNTPLIPEILRKSDEMAKLLGFETFADMSLSAKMAGDVATAQKLLDELWTAATPKAREEYAQVEKFARESGLEGEMKWWDFDYYQDKLRQKLFGYDEELVKKHFNLDRAIESAFADAHEILGVTIKAADGEAPVYQKDVRYFKVYAEGGEEIAAFYYDPYSRPGEKRSGAWMEELVRRRVLPDGAVQKPVAILSTNFTPPAGGKPARMSIDSIRTFRHELGHALQQMLTVIGYDEASGTNNIEWDAVEVASQLNEYWMYRKETLKSMSANEDNGAPLPDETIDKIIGARTFMGASGLMRLLIQSKTDLELYNNYHPDTSSESPYDVYNRYVAAAGRPVYAEGRFLNRFNHIFGGNEYPAGYFSYPWAKALAADYRSAFNGHLDDPVAIAVIGDRLRDTLYATGGARHPGDVFRDFMGREYSTDALLEDYGLK